MTTDDDAAEETARAFERAGERIAAALARASLSGEASFRRLAKTALEELARIALAQAAQGAGERRGSGGQGTPATTVHVNVQSPGGADALAAHQGQIAAAVARAVAYGRRNL